MKGPGQSVGARPDPIRFERFDLPGGIRLHVNSTPKLKTVLVQAVFTGNLDASVTRKSLLPMILWRGTARRPDMQAIARHLEDLYGTSLGSDVAKVGEWHQVKFTLEVVNDRFLPGGGGLVREGLSFLREMLFDPRFVDGNFDRDYLVEEKNNLRRAIEGLIDDKAHYAVERCVREMCAGEEYRRYELGDAADLDAIDDRGLTAVYKDWAARFPLDIHLSGDVEIAGARDLCAEVFSSVSPREAKGESLSLVPPPQRVRVKGTRTVEERLDVNQGKLILGYRHGTSFNDGDLPAMVMLNGVLGAFPHSKLFQNVREKASLAYDIHSSFEKSKRLFFVAAGIAVENYGRALEIIQAQLGEVAGGRISADELLATRRSLVSHLTLMEDSPGDLMEADRAWRLHGVEFDLPDYRSRIDAVTPERIAAAARDLELDTVYFLRS